MQEAVRRLKTNGRPLVAARPRHCEMGRGGGFQIAEVHAARGDADAAFEWLERAYVQRDGGVTETKVSPYFRPLHGDARWSLFLRRLRLDD